ncbi:MAG TPA: serine hydrolase domain-containing protein [Hyphomonadaceae bacterium]|nr:serine hydrolase domain-containing protein [Hyphomonadaceae bacterium]HPN07281.1 serine hydrolase domain-containing protein [Hyphomonadaceae bacterium]
MTQLTQRIDAALQSALDQKRLVGAVIAVMRDGELAHFKAYGLADREAGRAMKGTDIFRLASITKPIVTAAAMRMIELGKMQLDTPVTDFLPDFKPPLPGGSTPTITIRHLLTHTAGLSYDFLQPEAGPYNTVKVSAGIDGDLTMEENLGRMVQAGLTFPPGAMWLYSVAIDVLGAILAKIEGTDVEGVVQKYVTGPLAMTDTSFHVTDAARLAQPYSNAMPEPVRIGDNFKQPFVPGCAPINLGTSRAFNRHAFQGGGGCMNGTAGEIVRFLDTIRAGGGNILSPETTQAMMSNQIGPLRVIFDPTGNTAFGFGGSILLNPAASGSFLSPGTWQWGGVWGHSWHVDPTRKTTIVNLTNTTLEGMAGQVVRDVQQAVVG